MRKIDVSEWKEFKVGDLFDIYNSKSYHKNDIEESDDVHDLLYITRSKFNNGIKCRVKKRKEFIVNPAGTISFGAENADFFYQKEPYITGNKMYYIDTQGISELSSIFLKTVLQKSFSSKFSFSDGMIPSRIIDETILLPATPDGDPDWQYMEEYIRQLLEESEAAIGNLRQLKEKKKINVEGWKEFRVGDIGFEIIHGVRQTKADREDGDIPLLTAGKENQGLAEHISNPLVTCTDAISIDMFGNSFFHKGKYAGDDNIYFFVNSHLSSLSKMFISFVINKYNEGKYGYDHQFRQGQADNLVIPLPATPEGKPDYDFMESYIKGMIEKTADYVNILN